MSTASKRTFERCVRLGGADTRQKLIGLKLLFVPPDFNADREKDRFWLRSFLATSFSQDIAFGIVFGGFTKHVFNVFLDHGGPIGLKYAILHEIAHLTILARTAHPQELCATSNSP
jgi:hypothetical protein